MPLALFDLDNTLIAGDSDHTWGQFLADNGRVDPIQYKVQNDKFYSDYVLGDLNIYAYLEFSLGILAKIPMDELNAIREEFVKKCIAPMRLPKAQSLLKTHRDAGDDLIVITSTNRFIAEPICNILGVSDLLATELATKEGRYTGEVVGVPAYGKGKIAHINAWLNNNNKTLKHSFFYTDSINDLPLLLEVDNPIAVDPDGALHIEAKRRGWDVISLRD